MLQTCAGTRTKPQFLLEKAMEPALKYVNKKFPSLDARSNTVRAQPLPPGPCPPGQLPGACAPPAVPALRQPNIRAALRSWGAPWLCYVAP